MNAIRMTKRFACALALAAPAMGLTSCLESGETFEITRAAPKAVQYPQLAPLPIGEPVDIQPTIDGGAPTSWEVTPELPAGLTIDGTGRITGTPQKSARPGGFTIRAENNYGSIEAKIDIAVLPNDVRGLRANYWVELVADELEIPVKMQFTSDGRLIFGEMRNGRIREIGTDGELRKAPLAILPVGDGAQAGLLGIAVAPKHVSDAIYAYAIGQDKVGRIWRVREATAKTKELPVPELVVDDLPSGELNNGGDLCFGPRGKLWLTIGDCGLAVRAQREGDLAGRILRYEADGSIPIDNPDPKSPEWCRGLRNPFDLEFHPVTGGLFAIDNGVDTEDELNYVQRGVNFEWPEIPTNSRAPRAGIRLAEWTPAIAPTAIAWHNGNGYDPIKGRDLYLASYLDRAVRRLEMSGNDYTDIDREEVFLRFRDTDAGGNVPLGLAVGPKGNLYIATANAIWRVRRSDGDQPPMPITR